MTISPALFLGVLPPSRLKNALLRLICHYRVHGSARVGVILLINIRELEVGARGSIGHFNVFRDVKKVGVKDGSTIGQWNWISAAPPLTHAGAPSEFLVERESALTSRHYIDASGGIYIGAFSTVAGVRSTFITHGLNYRTARQQFRPIRIGNYVIIGSNCNLTPGAVVNDNALIGMGSTLSGPNNRGLALSPRATTVKESLDGLYFKRTRGFITQVERAPD